MGARRPTGQPFGKEGVPFLLSCGRPKALRPSTVPARRERRGAARARRAWEPRPSGGGVARAQASAGGPHGASLNQATGSPTKAGPKSYASPKILSPGLTSTGFHLMPCLPQRQPLAPAEPVQVQAGRARLLQPLCPMPHCHPRLASSVPQTCLKRF